MTTRTLRACAGCGKRTLTTRCTRCATARPTYDHTHRQARTHLLPLAWGTDCPLCGYVMLPSHKLDLDHSTQGMTHSSCNRRAGAAIVNAGQGSGGRVATQNQSPLPHPATFSGVSEPKALLGAF